MELPSRCVTAIRRLAGLKEERHIARRQITHKSLVNRQNTFSYKLFFKCFYNTYLKRRIIFFLNNYSTFFKANSILHSVVLWWYSLSNRLLTKPVYICIQDRPVANNPLIQKLGKLRFTSKPQNYISFTSFLK
jgi:hypothetical protein